MDEYIRKTDAINILSDMLEDEWGYEGIREDVASIVSKAPSADVAPVVHGKWILRGKWLRCSQCDEKALLKETGETGGFHEYEQVRSDYCPMCGAKMDLEGEHGGLHK